MTAPRHGSEQAGPKAGVRGSPALFAKIGEQKLRAVVTDFYSRIFGDVMIGFLFEGKSRQHLIDREYEFTASFLGGDVKYTGRPMRTAHAQSPIFGGHFERRLLGLRHGAEARAGDPARVERVGLAFPLREGDQHGVGLAGDLGEGRPARVAERRHERLEDDQERAAARLGAGVVAAHGDRHAGGPEHLDEGAVAERRSGEGVGARGGDLADLAPENAEEERPREGGDRDAEHPGEGAPGERARPRWSAHGRATRQAPAKARKRSTQAS